MPVEHPHPNITPLADPTARTWRYMDLARFVSLISRKELYFCNLEVLAATNPHEGLLSHPNYRHREWSTISDLTPEEYKRIFFDEARFASEESKRIQFESQRNSREFWVRRRFYDRRTLSVNCWHLNDDESAAMWMQYASGGNGIAITSSYKNIIEAFADSKEQTFVGMVKYLDWNNEPVDSTFGLPSSKRRSFSYENELRIVYWDLGVQSLVNSLCGRLSNHMMDHLYRRIDTPINWDMIEEEVAKVRYEPGLYIPVNLDVLIDDIYVAPTSPNWFLDVMNELCEKFDLARKPRRSDILASPIR